MDAILAVGADGSASLPAALAPLGDRVNADGVDHAAIRAVPGPAAPA